MEYGAMATALMEQTRRIFHTNAQRKLGEFTKGEMHILQMLVLQDKECMPSELTALMGVSSARTAAILNQLENKGLVTRKADPDDRRKTKVKITQNGREKVEAEYDRIHQMMEDVLRELGQEDAKEYLRLTERILEIAARHGEQCSY